LDQSIAGIEQALSARGSHGHRTQALLLPGLCAGVILIGLVMMLRGWEQAQRVRATASWPTRPGIIIGADVREWPTSEGIRFRPLVTYAYSVNGIEITNTRLSLEEAPYAYDHAAALAQVRHYRLQAPVSVYYNPERPTEAVLEQTLPRSACLNLLFGAILALPGSGLVLAIGLTLWCDRLPGSARAAPRSKLGPARVAGRLAPHAPSNRPTGNTDADVRNPSRTA
jgi:hypothetical protein